MMKISRRQKVLWLVSSALVVVSYYSNAASLQSTSDTSPRERLLQAMTAKFNAKSYRMKVVQVNEMMNSVMEGEYEAPDKIHVIGESIVMGRSSGKQEMILTGKDAYRKLQNGTWQKTEVDPQRMELTRARDQMLIDSLMRADNAAVKLIGEEELNGSPMFILQRSFAGTPPIPGYSHTKTWIGVKDGFPYKEESDAGATYNGKSISVKTTTTYSDYNAAIKIIRPK
jgi:hypothetical protein